MAQGTDLFFAALGRTTDHAMSGPTSLPGWTGRHLVAHVAANAEALLNLTHWAATGEETPMYASPGQRDADISAGGQRAPAELRRWVEDSARRLSAALAQLSAEQWARTVRTAQGRLVPAGEIPWLRAREVMIHSVDLDPALTFDALPEEFLQALVGEVVARRSGTDGPALALRADGGRHTWTVDGTGETTEVHGSLGGVAAYLTGRGRTGLTTPSGTVPDLPPWL